MSESPPPPQAGSDRLDRGVLVLGLVIVAGTIMAILDTTIVNVALQTLGKDFDTGLSTIQWVVTGYMLALGTVIPLTGWAIDRFGGRRVWMTSIVLFVAGSALSGAAWNIESLIAFRVLQGLGGGMLMPTGMAILSVAAGPRRMGRVMSIVGVPMLLGPILGPALGGWLVDNTDWRWIFLVNVPIGALALALAWWRVPAGSGGSAGRTKLDLRGLLLLPPAFALLIYGLSNASSHGGFGNAAVLGWAAAGAVLIALFVAHSLARGERALIDVRLFADRTFANASLAVLLVGVALIGSLLLLPLYYQTARGESAFAAGLLIAPQGIGAALAMPFAGQLTDRIGAGRVVPVGIVLLVLGTVGLTQVSDHTSYALLASMLFVRGLGLGSTMMPTMSSAIATLPQRSVARATSSLNILMQLGGSFGSALLAVLLSRGIADRVPGGGGDGFGAVPDAVRERIAPLLAEAFHEPFWVALGLTAVLIVPALLLPRHGTRPVPDGPKAETFAEVTADV
ncbi:putative transport protein HsrA [Actinomadura rubteroloni]|uniref:Putative transport protein HsrA n=1 Tax=Actinomadura rubteroloni TaxID=1926885 RepID=A0A2P4UGN2_9ACTN|nr:MDR family MFS transporter [Actinomadura rubteroloni]POM24222.1 putative transport protein HsrA [Actinomadura rubteroloni]